MQELVGRLTALDPEASQTLKVITYFDHLVEGRVSIASMVRGAAMLSGAPTGCRYGRVAYRVSPSGDRLPVPPSGDAIAAGWPWRPCGRDGAVWLERTGPAHANDAMVLERLAHSVTVTYPTQDPPGHSAAAFEVLLDPSTDPADREHAAARLGLELRDVSTVTAATRPWPSGPALTTPAAASFPPMVATTTVATAHGLVTAGLVRGNVPPNPTSPDQGDHAPALLGVGQTVTTDRLFESWAGAQLALRVATASEPIVRVDDLGLLVHAIDAAERSPTPPADVVGVERAVAHGWSGDALQLLADAESVRAVARAAGLHHSTVQARLLDLPIHLGFDPATGRGRVRLHTALLVSQALRPVWSERRDAHD